MIKKEVLEFLKKNPEGGYMGDGITVHIQRFNHRDNYYSRRDIANDLSDGELIDRIEFPPAYLFNIALENYFNEAHDANDLKDDLEEIVDEARQKYKGPVNYEDEEEVKTVLKELYENDDIDHDEIMNILDPDGQSLYEAIDQIGAYNTIYEPEDEDVEAAIEYNLVPFYLDGIFYLAFGGSGMDLSPRLDAYQALTRQCIPEGSMLLRDPQYARYILNDEVYEKALKRETRGNPLVKIYIEIEEEEI